MRNNQNLFHSISLIIFRILIIKGDNISKLNKKQHENINVIKGKIINFSIYIQIIISIVILLILFIGYQTYNYFKIQDIKNSSIGFFDIIRENQDDLSTLENIINDDNIFSILSKLKLIQKNNEDKNFSYSNELYKELLTT